MPPGPRLSDPRRPTHVVRAMPSGWLRRLAPVIDAPLLPNMHIPLPIAL